MMDEDKLLRIECMRFALEAARMCHSEAAAPERLLAAAKKFYEWTNQKPE